MTFATTQTIRLPCITMGIMTIIKLSNANPKESDNTAINLQSLKDQRELFIDTFLQQCNKNQMFSIKTTNKNKNSKTFIGKIAIGKITDMLKNNEKHRNNSHAFYVSLIDIA